jgi:protein ImuB
VLWIAVHLPRLSLESWAATLPPEQQGGPLALLQAHRIAGVNDAAAAAGVRIGHKRATALALAPSLGLGEADAVRDAQALQAAAHVALAFTPSVRLRADEHVVLLEVQASLRYFGGLKRLLQRLHAALAPLGHALQCASAPTALGAALLARWRRGLVVGSHSSSLQALARVLDAVPVELLGSGREPLAPGRASPRGALAPDEASLFEGMGLRLLRDLRRLPRAGLARRFGPGLLHELDAAYGERPDPGEWIVAPPSFDSRLELFARADTAEQVLHGASVLLQRLVAWAKAGHGRIGGFVLRMHHEPRHREGRAVAEHSTLDIELAEPSADAAHLQLLLRERLGRLALAAPTLELSVHCAARVPGMPPHEELFPTPRSEREGLGRLVERLQARLGRDGVQQLALRSDHRPECSSVWSAADGLAAVRAPGAAGAGPCLPLTRPAWLLPEPQPLATRQLQPLLDGRPLQLKAGPERLETGWWDAAAVQRDYFVAQAADGALVWIYRDRLPQSWDGEDAGSGWYLHGKFA